jgi:hypothetical protein
VTSAASNTAPFPRVESILAREKISKTSSVIGNGFSIKNGDRLENIGLPDANE